MLQAAALSPVWIGAVAKVIDMVIKAEINSNVHVEHLLKKIKKIGVAKPALSTPHHPITERKLFESDAHKAAVCCNVHEHTRTCHSGRRGKIQCRMALPKENIHQTGCFQIKPCSVSKSSSKGMRISYLLLILFKIKKMNFFSITIFNRDRNSFILFNSS